MISEVNLCVKENDYVLVAFSLFTDAFADALPLLKTPTTELGFSWNICQPSRLMNSVRRSVLTVSLFFPMFLAENPCIKARPAGMFNPLPFLLILLVPLPGGRSSSSLDLLSRGAGLGSTIAFFARLRSRRSARPTSQHRHRCSNYHSSKTYGLCVPGRLPQCAPISLSVSLVGPSACGSCLCFVEQAAADVRVPGHRTGGVASARVPPPLRSPAG